MKTNLVVMGLLSLTLHGVAVAGGSVVGATEFTQLANNAQLAAGYAESAKQTVTQMQQYAAMLQNLRSMTPSALLDQAAQQLFTDQKMYGAFKDLQTVVVDGQKMAYASATLEQQFKVTHPGYGGYTGAIDFISRYRNTSDNTLSAVKNALGLVTSHSEKFVTEQGMMQELLKKSQTAEGQKDALQAGNQIGLAMIGQMQQLRQLEMAQMRQQGAYIGGQQNKDDLNDAAMNQFYNRGVTRVRSVEEITRDSQSK